VPQQPDGFRSELAEQKKQIEALTAGLQKARAELARGRVRVAAVTGLELNKSALQTDANGQ
jgi:hypothetical protein